MDKRENTNKKFWTYADLSYETGIPISTLQKYVSKGWLDCLRFGRRVRFDPDDAIDQLRHIGKCPEEFF